MARIQVEAKVAEPVSIRNGTGWVSLPETVSRVQTNGQPHLALK